MKHIMSPSGIHLPNKHSGHLHIQCESRSESGAQPKQFWDMSQPPQRRSILSCNALSARHAWTAATHKLVAMPICHVLGIGSPPAPAPVPLQHRLTLVGLHPASCCKKAPCNILHEAHMPLESSMNSRHPPCVWSSPRDPHAVGRFAHGLPAAPVLLAGWRHKGRDLPVHEALATGQ